MADNVAVTAGSGVSIASDDIGGVQHQRVKLGIGADGTAVDAQPADADGKAATALLSSGGMVYNGSTWDRARSVAGDTVASTGLHGVVPALWNGATFDRQRGNTEGTLLASAARTATSVSATQTNYNHRGVHVALSVTVAGTGNLTIQIVGSIGGSATWIRILASYGPITATGVYDAELYPGIGVSTDEVQDRTSGSLPRSWDARVAHTDGSSWTYSLGYSLIV
jgi:hypothetical protein